MTPIEDSQALFYGDKFSLYGDDPRSLSWNDRESQRLRFQHMAGLFKHERDGRFSVHEVGCGLGHFKEYLDLTGHECEYSGSDILPGFVGHCRNKYPKSNFYLQSIADDLEHIEPQAKGKDYYCMSGTFYTKGDNPVSSWERFVFKSMENMFRMANKGICVNFLTSYADFYDDDLYYANPGHILGFISTRLSRHVSILHDLPLFEFFVYVYKDSFIRKQFPGYERYFEALE